MKHSVAQPVLLRHRLSPGNRRDSVEAGNATSTKSLSHAVYLPAIAGTPLKQIADIGVRFVTIVYLPAIAGTPLKLARRDKDRIDRRLSPGNRRDSVEALAFAGLTPRESVYLPAIAGTPLKHGHLDGVIQGILFISRQSPGLR